MQDMQRRGIIFIMLMMTLLYFVVMSLRTLKEEEKEKLPTKVVTETTNSTEEENNEISIYAQPEFQDRCRITYAEAGIESKEGQIAVAAVILNREESSNYPDSFYEVIFQKNQFSPVIDGEIYNDGKVVCYETIPQETIEAVKKALNGEDPTEQLLWKEAERLGLDPEKYAKGGALYFYDPRYCSQSILAERANIRVKVQIGNHIFYKVWG